MPDARLERNAAIPEKLTKRAHGGVVGSAHPATIRELYEAEELKKKHGKLAHGGIVGSAHPAAIDDIVQPEIDTDGV
jgi:hypothetical protein